jgi:two-component system sensor histidine kinase AlgZ
MKDYTENPFIFSPRYRLLRHLTFWIVNILVFSFLFKVPRQSWGLQLAESAVWVIAFIIYCYPVMYLFIPRLLLKGKLIQFLAIIIVWGVAGYFFNYFYRKYVFFTLTQILSAKMNLPFVYVNANPWAPSGYIVMNLMAGYGSMIVLFKYWVKKQKDFLNAEKEKVNAELQLLKAQVHPHFLFNTLNNIYSFSLQNSNKAPQMILKLSSLLSYMLYDCRGNEVLLEKEIEIMKNYVDLEKERYENLEVSLNFEGDIKDKWIAPLLLLPFLENAFKHGTSEQLEKCWLNLDISVKQNMMRCKIANSKNEMVTLNEKGIGVENVRKRLAYLYPGKHELKLSDEGDFFVVSLLLDLTPNPVAKSSTVPMNPIATETISV